MAEMKHCVLLSIQPKWCELIASGKKTVEIRKTKPKIETPFKCYIYETKGETDTPFIDEDGHLDFHGRGQVIGEFICDNILYWQYSWNSNVTHICKMSDMSCVPIDELIKYAGEKQRFFAWHITDLVIYDTPKELSEFFVYCERCDKRPIMCEYLYEECNESVGYYSECMCDFKRPIKKPPQSWCYVEEQEG